MAKQFDPQNLKILKEQYFDKGITNLRIIGILWGKSESALISYKKRLNGTFVKKENMYKKHKLY